MSPRRMSPYSTLKRCPRCKCSLILMEFRLLDDPLQRTRRATYCRECEVELREERTG